GAPRPLGGRAAGGAPGASVARLAALPGGAGPPSLSDRRVLAVAGDGAGSGGACGIEDDGPADDERLLVRQGHIGAPGQGGQCRSETGGTGDRVEDHVGLETRDRLGGGVTEVDDLDGIADPAGGGECGQSAADLGLSPGRRGGQSDDGNAEIESLLEQQIELGSGRQPDDRMLVAVSGQNVEGLGADRSGGADYNESTFTHANR